MGMNCEVNNTLKLKPSQGYPQQLSLDIIYKAKKSGYRIYPIDVPIDLMDESGTTQASVIIERLEWFDQVTSIDFRILMPKVWNKTGASTNGR